jgi:Fe-S cluster biogenesis protein NfuA
MKFIVTSQIASETVNMPDAASSYRSPLAQKLFGFPWLAGVLVGPNFVTVSKQDWVDWETLADPLSEMIKEHIESGEPVIVNAADVPEGALSAGDFDENDSPAVRLIKTVLNQEIRPAVAMDGGDIVFDRYEDNILYLHMQGSCAGCPSSTMTLKQGIEGRMKEVLPEIIEVVSV